MGTSRAAMSPSTKRWAAVVGTLRAPDRNASTVVNITLSVAASTMPAISPVTTPIVLGISEGLRFALDVKESGFEGAVEREAIRLSVRYVIPSVSEGLWNVASSKMDPKFSGSPFGRLAELAFKKTMNQVMSKGARALIEGEE